MIVLAILQASVLPSFPIFGVVPQLPLLIALSRGLLRGVNEGVLWAFLAGICLDLLSTAPMGATSLAFMGATLSITWIARALPANRLVLPVVFAALATLISLFLYFLVLRLLGQQTDTGIVSDLLPVTLVHAGLILPVYWLMYAIEQTSRPRRVTI
jgi:rod shape-determining protein MreD